MRSNKCLVDGPPKRLRSGVDRIRGLVRLVPLIWKSGIHKVLAGTMELGWGSCRRGSELSSRDQPQG